MSTAKMFFFVFLGIFAALSLCSFGAWVLGQKEDEHKRNSELRFVSNRINAWWGFSIFLGMAIWVGEIGLLLFFGFISLQCLREYISITKTRISDHHALIWSFYVFLPLQYIVLGLHKIDLSLVLIPVFAFLLLPVTSVLRGDTRQFLSRAAQVQWGLMICVYFLSHVPALMMLDIADYEGKNALLIVFFLLTALTNNVFEYIWDKLMGSHQLVPSIPASKSVEGMIVGLLCSMLLGALMHWMTPFSTGQAALLALAIGLVGFAGRLVLLAIKQDRGVANWGGHNQGEMNNGMLDLIDSMCFSAPVFFYLVRFFWA